jgi:MFS family permease
MERGINISLAVLFFVGVIDSVSYMAIAPSLTFYVGDLGGSKEQYGLIMSAFSFASFCFKPLYGYWVDATGNKYKTPFFASFSLAIIGNIMYWLAILMPHGEPAIYCLLVARLFAGMGAANNTLGFSYLATAVPHEKQTTFNVLLSVSRIVGMTIGPFINMALNRIDTEYHLGSLVIPMNSRNSVGLIVAGGNLLVLVVTMIFMQEPSESKKEPSWGKQNSRNKNELWNAIFCLDIMVPIFIILVVNCNFQM